MGQFATLADVKKQINSTSSVNDDELTLMLDAAEERVASLVGSFDAVAVTERVTVHGGTVLLSQRPSGPVLLNGGAVTGFTTSPQAGVLYDVPYGAPCDVPFGMSYDTPHSGGVLTATYTTAGDGTPPASVTLATAIIAAHLWDSQRGFAPNPLQPPEDLAAFGGRPSFAIPNRAKELLEPYLLSSGQAA